MLSIPHMIVVFVVILVVFGPQKLPELARSFGKLMAEFRKASNDFKNAFEEEMRDLERQARLAELKKQVSEANAAANAAVKNALETGNPASTPATSALGEVTTESRSGEGPVIRPVAEAVPRLDGANGETAATAEGTNDNEVTESPGEPSTNAEAKAETSPSHDQRQPA